MHSPSFTSTVRGLAGMALTGLLLAALASRAQDLDELAPLSVTKADPAVRERIRAFEAGTARAADMPLSFQGPDGRPVYLLNAPCCDQFNRLYDGDGRYICAPTGGFAGEGAGDCPAWVRTDVRWNQLRLPRPRDPQPWPPRQAG